MSNIVFCHGYTTKYVIMNRIKKLKKLIYTNNCKISKIGGIWIKSDFRLICGCFFVTRSHNNTENEILSSKKIIIYLRHYITVLHGNFALMIGLFLSKRVCDFVYIYICRYVGMTYESICNM
jgi:hypothetical protein